MGANGEHPDILKLNFCEVPQGTQKVVKATLKNIGNIPLSMNGFSLVVTFGNPGDFKLVAPTVQDLSLDPGMEQPLELTFLPSQEGPASASIDVVTNDFDLKDNTFKVRMLAESKEPDIQVIPDNIPFVGVNQGSQDTKPITVHNLGSGVLVITDLSVTGGTQDGEFTIDPTAGFEVEPAGQATINVTYSPKDVGQDEGSVTIHSNDPDTPTVTVTLGAEVRPDIDVTPADQVVFSGVAPGGSASQDVVLRNVGHAELTVNGIEFPAEHNPGNPPVFALENLPAGFPAAPLLLQPAEAYTFTVLFTDNTLMKDEVGELHISHDSPNDTSPYILLVSSQGTPANLPPMAKIVPSSLVVNGKDPITLDGSQSSDPDAGDSVAVYSWQMLFRPTDPVSGNESQAALDSTDQPQTTFTPDLNGKYIVRLQVFDTHGAISLPADAEISVNP
jgi:hypothetical protein